MRNKWVVHPLVDARTPEQKLVEAFVQSSRLTEFRKRRATQANQPRKRLMPIDTVVKKRIFKSFAGKTQ